MNDADRTVGWEDEDGVHPLSNGARNSMPTRKADAVLRVIRNALAHGNIVYLNENGTEEGGTKLQFLAFLSRYEQTEDELARSKTYRLVVVPESEFLRFVKLWARWVSLFPADDRISDGDEAG